MVYSIGIVIGSSALYVYKMIFIFIKELQSEECLPRYYALLKKFILLSFKLPVFTHNVMYRYNNYYTYTSKLGISVLYLGKNI